jgi:trimeric autotransporter adhesin
VIGDTAGTGVIGTLRAQATGAPVAGGSGFFNTAAFTTPVSGTYGDAGRNTIPGIPYYSLTASFFRSFRIDDKRRFEFRIDSTNPLNSVEIRGINTTVGSINYGIATNAYAMRSVTATARLRF